MPKFNFAKYQTIYFIPSVLADILEKHGVKCDRKKNGSIWANSTAKSVGKLYELKRVVSRVCKEHKDDLPEWVWDKRATEWDYTFFDHAYVFTKADGGALFAFFPYHCESSWPYIIPYIEEKGYAVTYCDSKSDEGVTMPFVIVEEKA